MFLNRSLFLVTVAVFAAVAARPAEAQEEDAAAVVRGFHQALAAGDSTRALSFLHPDVTIYEGGHAESLSDYRSGHLRSDMAFLAEMTRDVQAEETVARGDAVLYTSVSRTTGTFRGREIDSRGTESMLLVRGDDGAWKIRHIHWSSR